MLIGFASKVFNLILTGLQPGVDGEAKIANRFNGLPSASS
jgi:hypothetical protein